MSTAISVTDGQLMTWAEFQALGEDPRLEYIDGHLVVSPSATRRHQKICTRLLAALEPVLPPSFDVALAWAWKPASDEFIPDVMVHPVTDEDTRFTGVPALVIEVLSTNRSDDLVLKGTKYATAGLPHYWVVDPRDRSLDAFVLDRGAYRRVQHATITTEPIELNFGVAAMHLDLGALLS